LLTGGHRCTAALQTLKAASDWLRTFVVKALDDRLVEYQSLGKLRLQRQQRFVNRPHTNLARELDI